MDVPQPDSPALRRDLTNLATLNRLFGSYSLILRHIQPWLHAAPLDRPIRLLDFATASGDIPRLLVDAARSRGINLQIDAIDQQASTIAIARELSADYPEITYHEGDILTFGTGETWDIVHCSLAIHHFSEPDAITVLRQVRELSSRHALAADLRRSPLGTFGVDLLTAVWMREPMTRNDARASVRRAFTFEEMAALARSAGWTDYHHERNYAFRQSLRLTHVGS
ncbi:MAG: methyltransferase domain-containing protein [Chthoniobacterales bacterium]